MEGKGTKAPGFAFGYAWQGKQKGLSCIAAGEEGKGRKNKHRTRVLA